MPIPDNICSSHCWKELSLMRKNASGSLRTYTSATTDWREFHWENGIPIFWSKAAAGAAADLTRGCCTIRRRYGAVIIPMPSNELESSTGPPSDILFPQSALQIPIFLIILNLLLHHFLFFFRQQVQIQLIPKCPCHGHYASRVKLP